MFDFEEIRKLVELVESRDIDEIEVTRLWSRLKIRRRISDAPSERLAHPIAPASVPVPTPMPEAPAPKPVPPESADAVSEETDLIPIRSPMVGTFYRSPAPDAEVYTEEGKRVERGQVVCIVEAMKLMNEIESDVSGTIVECLVENAQPVQYDQTLFLVRAG